MERHYSLINYWNKKTIMEFKGLNICDPKVSEYMWKYKILDIKKLTFSNREYVTLIVLDWSQEFQEYFRKPLIIEKMRQYVIALAISIFFGTLLFALIRMVLLKLNI